MKKLFALLLALAMLLGCIPAMADATNNTIVYTIEKDPQEMDPTLNSYSLSSQVLQQLFRGLYKLNPEGNGFIPAMAESYTLSEDQKTYTFTLKEGLLWSDGTPLTAHDFEYSWKRVANPDVASKASSDMWVLKNSRAYTEGNMTADEVGVKALDDLTLEVVTENLCPWFLSLTATTSFLPVKKDVVEAEGDPWTKSPATYVCNGPYMPLEFSSLEHVKMIKNPNYVDADKIQVENLNYVVISDFNAALTAYNNGDIHVLDNLTADAFAQYADSPEYRPVARIGVQYCDFNCELPEFSDVRVRRAFSISLNRQAILAALRLPYRPVYGYIPYAQPSLTAEGVSYREIAGDMFEENVEEAQALMAEAGYPNGEGFPVVRIVAQSSDEQKLLVQILGEMWKQNLGISYEITNLESSTYWDELDEGNFSIDRNAFTCDYPDPVANLTIFTTGSNAYENRWDDAAYDEMILSANQITDPAEREAALIAAEAYLVAQMPAMPIYSMDSPLLVKPNVKGIVKNVIGHTNFEYATIE